MTIDWNDALKFILTFLASIGGAGVVSVALIAWIGKVLENNISIRLTTQQNRELEGLKNTYNVELEKLRAEVTRQRDTLSNISATISSGYMATHPHIVDAIKALWLSVIEIGNLSSSFLLFHNTRTEDEIEKLTPEYVSKRFVVFRSEFESRSIELSINTEICRPFVGEKLWTLYYVYQAFALRICVKMYFTQANYSKLYAWNKDTQGQPDVFMFDTLRAVLTEDELKWAMNLKMGAPFQILNLLKTKILSEMNELVLGKRLLSMSIEEQQTRAELFSRPPGISGDISILESELTKKGRGK